jgi:uncharacterized membrane protein YdbT with pleckstrin-like domain
MNLPVHPSEEAVAASASGRASLATLLTRHILRDGELVLLILKPSLWSIVLTALPFAAVVLMATAAAIVVAEHHSIHFLAMAVFLLGGRVVWSILQWMGRLYLLTNLRIVALSGVFNIEIFDCPLRRVAQARLQRRVRERLLGIGTIEIVPSGDRSSPCASERGAPGYWHMIARPVRVHEQVAAAINRAKHNGQGRNHAA